MPIQYDKKAVLEMCADAMKNPALFYTQNLVNYQGICSDAQVPYTEIIAEFLIDHLPEFTDGITQIHRTASYCTPTHMGPTPRTVSTRSPAGPSFWRRVRICTSTVLLSPSNSYPQI